MFRCHSWLDMNYPLLFKHKRAKPGTYSRFKVLAIVVAGFLGGVMPSLSDQSSIAFLGAPAYGQSFSDAELKNYAKAVLAIEPIRQSAYTEIKRTAGSGDVPAIVCSQPDSLKNLPNNTRTIAVNYCNQSKKIVESHGLTTARFNAITVKLQGDNSLGKRIQAELLRLQRPASTILP